jgi:hypothetical protein
VFNEVSKVKGWRNKIRLLFSKPGATISSLGKVDTHELKKQGKIYYSPLNEAI